MYRTDKYVKNLLQIFLLCNKISFMNELLNKLTNYFPGVIWIDFTGSKGIENFWEILEDINTQTENPKTFLLKLFKYQKNNAENTKKEIFKYMLPEETFVKEIPQEYFDKQNNFFQSILDYEEVLFLKELIDSLKINESDLSNEDDGYYPVAKYYPKWNDWLCFYDKKHYRFYWDSEIDYDILMYNPNNPFDAFIRKCQHDYTLLRLGYENQLDRKTKNILKNNGQNVIYNHFKLSSLYSKVDNDEKIDALIGNIRMGLESKADKESEFYPKTFEQTIKKIDFCRFEKKFERKKYLEKYQLSYEEYKKIREIYDEKEKLEWSGFYALEKENVFLRLSILNYNIERLPENERKIIYTINKRLKETRTISFDAPSSKDSEDTDNLYDIVEDKNDYNKKSFNEIENRKESLVTALKQEFSSSRENLFHDILDAYAESYDKFAILDAALYEILYAKTKDISNNELFLKYLKIINKDGYAINKKIQSLFKNKINSAIEKLKEEING